ncbi:MAG: hypothetical protein NC225_07860 [Clostridium sp.]|nr:hypothetical protein [Clostridium sp.]MCM1460580.1 hypothetical protein [Bacteroides sp.]
MNKSLQHNEIITGISILSVLKYSQTLDVSKVMLIEPFLSYKSVLDLMARKNSSIQSVEDIIIKESISFVTFNERYRERFKLSVNAIMLFDKLRLLRIEDNMIAFCADDFDFNNDSLGKVVNKRVRAAKKLAEILMKGEASDLYLSLRVEL